MGKATPKQYKTTNRTNRPFLLFAHAIFTLRQSLIDVLLHNGVCGAGRHPG
jgi:hypothetical protein